MAKQSQYEPIMAELVKDAGEAGITVGELVEQTGASRQQAYRVMGRLPVQEAGKSDTGAARYVWAADGTGDGQSPIREQRSPRVLILDKVLRISGLRRGENGRVEIEMEDENGERHLFKLVD